MQSSTSDTGQVDAAYERPLSAELSSVLAGARRRALRDGDRQIDTAHLLHSLLEADPAVRAAIPGGEGQLARLLGYLVQRSIGYGLRWRGSVEDSPAVPARRAGWSPAAATAMARARLRSGERRGERVEGLDLLAALVRDHRCRAADVLRWAGVDADALFMRLDAPDSPPPPGR
ncbi:Clp protease N-terminal domain-containing protein [Streptomyces orinoci]|uniref:Clp protease N-terminal domain-containing protein n=1 Tax=Streptomyces orinoci TaxID=67339 RepID=A0ABV3KBF2_STRON|nr:Clp protease N-terminal domain-containing protein [Streptomyces orinoci]